MMSLRDSFNISNKTGESDEDSYGNDNQPEIPPYIGYLINGFIFIIISFNLPSVFVLLCTKVKQSNFVSIHILSLSLTDCGVGIAFLLFVSTGTFNYWDCWARFFFFNTMYANSMTQVAVICLDRVLLFYNLSWKSVTKNSALISKIVLATFSLSMLSTAMTMAIFATPHDTSMCGIEVIFKGKIQAFRLYIGTLLQCIECFTVSCTVIIIRFLVKRKHVHPQTSNAVHNNMDKETQAIITLLIIVGVYIILSTPLNVMTLVSGVTGKSAERKIAMPLFALSCLNSACNPIIYSFRIPEMKEAFKAIWNKVRCR